MFLSDRECGKRGRLQEKVCVVTGGANGIGEAVCRMFAKEGATVAVTDISEADGQEVAEAIRAAQGFAHFWPLDVSNEDCVERVFSEIVSRYGAVHVLVNNAGIPGPNKPGTDLTEAEFDRVFAVDVKGPFFCTKHAVPYMAQCGGGSVVNIASIASVVATPADPLYHFAKGAIRLMTKKDALQYSKHGIRVNCVHPGTILTPFNVSLGQEYPGGFKAFIEYWSALHPIGHPGEPDDVAYGVLYLASDEAKFVTGSELAIDGGYTAQ